MITVYCDGGARGNPGPAAYGFVVKKNGQIIKSGSGYLGKNTNNFAEYMALIEALNWLSREYKKNDLKIFLDSKLVVSQLSGLYKVKSSTIRELVFQVRQLEPIFGRISYHHIGREQNKEADKLVNLELDRKTQLI